MLKKLDWYIIKTFLGPFFFIFSVLFFIFIVQFAWQQMQNLIGKGLDSITIAELLFWLGINVVQLVLPLTILLGSIMTMGGFGERYELAAMKASGISLTRILAPLFVLIMLLSIGLYFFGDKVMPFSARKARSIYLNIIQTKPTANMKEGVFIETVPGFQMKINKVSGENSEKLEDVFVHQNSSSSDNTMTIIAKKGNLAPDKNDNNYLKMELYDGVAYTDNIKDKNINQRKNQENQYTKFDTLNYYIDISEIINSGKEEDPGNSYKFLDGAGLRKLIDSLNIDYKKYYKTYQTNVFNQNYFYTNKIKTIDSLKTRTVFALNKKNKDDQDRVLNQAIQMVNRDQENLDFSKNEIINREKLYSKIDIQYQRNFSYAVTCIIFFLIGSSLGAIVKKGGIGMPVIISIIIFVIYFIINFSAENMAKNGTLNSGIAAWLANIISLPFSILFCFKANQDSELFNISLYLDPIIKYFNKFKKTNKNEEHSRYQ
ncbi:LptF/LptG family permease [Chishuiella sp.]|uniref:LptF/LptG family permease n=1 Tax=Chishuiella sp. TaxID=1969467 RepID=UPI0028A93B73|nr:LptF/LptG family permease [Chishuiella sp.]